MLVTPTIYSGTKFSPTNPPDSPAIITNNYVGVTLPQLDILQEVIGEISVKATWQQIQDADILSLYNTVTGDTWWYYITSVPLMTSIDVARLSIQIDGILSVGGFSALNILGGITIRHHVVDDNFGEYTEPDPLLICREPLILELNDGWSFSDYDHVYTIMESTVNLADMGQGVNPPSEKWVDPNDSSIEVIVPKTIPVTNPTDFSAKQYNTADIAIPSPGTGFFVSTVDGTALSIIQTGSARCRDISAESAIVSQYQVPDKMVSIAYNVGTGLITQITGRTSTSPDNISHLPYDFSGAGYTVRNRRLLYGDLCKYGIITTDGNMALYNPEEIYDFNGSTYPTLIFVTDPRPSGRPYFRFEYYNREQGEGDAFWINCLPGAPWRQVPLIYNTPSGVELTNNRYALVSSNIYQQYKNTQWQAGVGIYSGALSTVQGGASNIASRLSDYAEGYGVAANGGINRSSNIALELINTPISLMQSGVGIATAKDIKEEKINLRENAYYLDMASGLAENAIANEVVVPTIQLPGDTKILRDIKGNGCLVYRYHPSQADIERQDKILTMYGYKDSTILETSFFNNRQKFNYIQATGVEVGNNIPSWHKAIIAQQFLQGMRIWHVLPDTSHYANNPIQS